MKFEVVVKGGDYVDVRVKDVFIVVGEKYEVVDDGVDNEEVFKLLGKKWVLGYCVGCCEVFMEWEMEMLVGFVCGYVYYLLYLLEKMYLGERVD